MVTARHSLASTKHPVDHMSVYISAGLLSGVGASISTTMPMVIGTMAKAFKFSEASVVKHSDNAVNLTSEGAALQAELIGIAIQHENGILNTLSEEEIRALKKGLKIIVETD